MFVTNSPSKKKKKHKEKDKIKNWEFYKADSDALKNNFNTKIVYNFKDFLIELPSASIVYTHWWARSIITIILSRIFKKNPKPVFFPSYVVVFNIKIIIPV